MSSRNTPWIEDIRARGQFCQIKICVKPNQYTYFSQKKKKKLLAYILTRAVHRSGRIGSGLGLTRTQPDWIGWTENRPVADRTFGSSSMEQVISWAGRSLEWFRVSSTTTFQNPEQSSQKKKKIQNKEIKIQTKNPRSMTKTKKRRLNQQHHHHSLPHHQPTHPSRDQYKFFFFF